MTETKQTNLIIYKSSNLTPGLYSLYLFLWKTLPQIQITWGLTVGDFLLLIPTFSSFFVVFNYAVKTLSIKKQQTEDNIGGVK